MDTDLPSTVDFRTTLTGRARSALDVAILESGDSEPDTVNRAILTYALVHTLTEQGGGTITLASGGGRSPILLYVVPARRWTRWLLRGKRAAHGVTISAENSGLHG